VVPVQEEESLPATGAEEHSHPAQGEDVVDASIRYDWMGNDSEVLCIK
jgi:hypothetical protein